MPRINTNVLNNSSPNQYLVAGAETQDNVSSQANGDRTTFTTTKSIDVDLSVSINGLIYTVADTNVSFTAGDSAFTLSFAPQSDDVVIAIYKSYN